MSLPNSLHGNEYYKRLSALRDEALTQSHAYGRRRQLGCLSFGATHAQWRVEPEGMAFLHDVGLRIGDTTLLNSSPTTMRIFNHYGSEGMEVVTFKMDLDDIGNIEVFRHMATSASFVEVMRIEMSKRADRRYNMSAPTDDELVLVYTEMERGASGLFRPEQSLPPE